MISVRRRCAACKCLRRKCPQTCIFAPYFPSDDPQRFACVHKIYGAKNVAKMLQEIPADQRARAVDSMQFEAQRRIEEPVYGCVRIISQLHEELRDAEAELAKTRAQIAMIGCINMQSQTNHDREDRILQFHGQRNDVVQPSQIGPSTQSPWML